MATNQEKIEALTASVNTWRGGNCSDKKCTTCQTYINRAKVLEEMIEELQDEELKK